jgi:hypothetical protein
VADAKLYTAYINANRYLYLNVFDGSRTIHLYAGSPSAVEKQLAQFRKVIEVWDKLDPASKKAFASLIEQIDREVQELKSQLALAERSSS